MAIKDIDALCDGVKNSIKTSKTIKIVKFTITKMEY